MALLSTSRLTRNDSGIMHVNRARNRFGLCKKHGGGRSDCNSEEAVEEHGA